MLTKEQKKKRIQKIKFAAEEFLQDVGKFSVESLYFFFWGIAKNKKYSYKEIENIINFLIKTKGLKVKQTNNEYALF
jgi:hypothetical protein